LSGHAFGLKFILSHSWRAQDDLKSKPKKLFPNSLYARGSISGKQLISLSIQNNNTQIFDYEKLNYHRLKPMGLYSGWGWLKMTLIPTLSPPRRKGSKSPSPKWALGKKP